MLRRIAVIGLILGVAGVVRGESMRPLMTKENAFPGRGHVELGSIFFFTEFEDEDEATKINDFDTTSATPYARVGLADSFALFVDVPFREVDRDLGEDASGMGDMSVGFELLAFEDIFDYPYVIPHVAAVLDTGDEDDGLGVGENSAILGLSVGTVVNDVVHFIADASYRVFEDRENIGALALTIMWDISKQLSVLAEVGMTDDEIGLNDSHPTYYNAGMSYKPIEDLALTVYGGGANNANQDVSTGLKIAYSF